MCADFRSDGLVRQYSYGKNSFSSQFDNISVGCLACHDDMSEHVKKSIKQDVVIEASVAKHLSGQWLRSLSDKTAHW
jgi:hypothetical protein